METALTASLILLVIVIIIAIIASTVYLVKFLIQLTLLTKNLDETTTVVKKEIEPILGEVKETLITVNSIAKNADNQLATLKKIIATILGFFSMFASKFKFLQSSFFKGFMSSLNFFRKK